LPVLRIAAPGSIGIEIGVARRVARYIPAGRRKILAAIAILAKIIEGIGGRRGALVDHRRGTFGSRNTGLFSGMDGNRLAVGGGFGIASADGHDGRVAGFIYIDAIIPGAKQREGKLRRIDLDSFIVGEAPQADVQRSSRELNLRGLIVQI
jgi:hypothetical protein